MAVTAGIDLSGLAHPLEADGAFEVVLVGGDDSRRFLGIFVFDDGAEKVTINFLISQMPLSLPDFSTASC
jgi:hypothetical protein